MAGRINGSNNVPMTGGRLDDLIIISVFEDMAILGRANRQTNEFDPNFSILLDVDFTHLNNVTLERTNLTRLFKPKDHLLARFITRHGQVCASSIHMPHSGKVGDCVVVHAIVIGLANDEKSMTTLYSRWFNVQVEAPIDAFNVGAQPTINQTVVVRMQQIDGGKWLAIAVELLPLIVGCGAMVQVNPEYSYILYNEAAPSTQLPFRYCVVPNSIVKSNGKACQDWYGCRVQFTACSDQSDSRDDQIVMYKAIAAEIIDGPKLSNGDNEQFGLAEQILRDLPMAAKQDDGGFESAATVQAILHDYQLCGNQDVLAVSNGYSGQTIGATNGRIGSMTRAIDDVMTSVTNDLMTGDINGCSGPLMGATDEQWLIQF